MKSFFSTLIASFLGVFCASLVLFFVLIAGIVGLFNEIESHTGVQQLSEGSVLTLSLDYPISEKTSDDPFAHYDFDNLQMNLRLGLDDIVDAIQRGANDDSIEGIYLNLAPVSHGWATADAIRNALLEFKASGKWIIAYAEYYSHGSYYLSSVADKMYMNPEGFLEFQGLQAQSLFLKDALAKLEIDMQVVRGPDNEYKSAVETFVNSGMSDSSRFQTQVLVDEIWTNVVGNIAQDRNLDVDVLNAVAARMSLNSPQAAVDYNMIDALRYDDAVWSEIRERMSIDSDDSVPELGVEEYASMFRNQNIFGEISLPSGGDQIAVIYAEGDIMSGENQPGILGSSTTSRAIRAARKDGDVKAIVLRVNSPGGSALASEVILREVYLARDEKPVVVSFGDVAASGGYYIASAGNKIFAQPSTVTGSIGVFGLMPNMQGFFNNKLGMTFESVTSHPYADFGDTTRPLKPFEQRFLNQQITRIYQTFIKHVADGRSLSDSEVEAIARGRVWSGVAALDVGLVDEIGGLSDAIASAAVMAGVDDYQLLKLPRAESPFMNLLSSGGARLRHWLATSTLSDALLGERLVFLLQQHELLNRTAERGGVLARMPFELSIE